MRSSSFVIFFLIASLNISAQNKNYFISGNGNDNNDGLSIHAAWKTISKVNATQFLPGDIIHFNGGETFAGMVLINSNQSGASSNPVVFKSFGQGRAIIDGGTGDGIWIYNAEFVHVRDLIVMGNGVNNNNGAGVYASTSLTDKMLDGVVIDNVEIFGFYWMGIGVATEGKTTKGFLNLRITNATVYDNGMSGIETSGAWDEVTGTAAFNHVGMYIGYTKVYQNYGISTYTSNWSGTGILMSGVENGLIEYCVAYDNGKNNGCTSGGPVGIWLANAKNCIIQYCESYNNKAGKSKDGGGFDIDGGSQNCIIQYCYSHDNEGPGYALFEWGNNIPFTENIIRYNISQNDARKNSYGALTFWGVDASHKVLNSHVYNNTIYVSKKGLINGTPSAVKFMGTNMKDLKIRNNIFHVTEGIRMIHSSASFDTTVAHFQNNNYFDTTGLPSFYFRYNYPSLSSWKNAAAGQEMRGSVSLGYSNDPLFVNPGGASIINPADGGDLSYLTAYMIQPGSPMIDAGLDLSKLTGMDIGTMDFYKNNLADIEYFDIGANEFNVNKFMTMPLKFKKFNAAVQDTKLFVEWSLQPNPDLLELELQVSKDGRSFETIKHYPYTAESAFDLYSELIPHQFKGSIYCRLKATLKGNKTFFSTYVRVANPSQQKNISVYPNPVKGNLNISMPEGGIQNLYIRNNIGHVIYEKKINDSDQLIYIDTEFLKPGFYILEFKNGMSNTKKTMPFVKQ